LEARDDRLLGVPVKVWGIPVQPHQPLADVVCDDERVRAVLIPLLASHLRREPRGRNLLVVGPLPSDSVLWDGLRHMDRVDVCTNNPMSSHVFACTRPYEALNAGFSKSFRAKLRKARRRLESMDGVRFVTAFENTSLQSEFEMFLDVEASGWKGAGGTRTAVRFRDGQPAFFGMLARAFGPNDRCEINSLYAEGSCIASQYCMRTGSEYAILKSGFDESYSRISPGQLLREETLRRCCEDSQIARCSLVSDYAWQHIWHPDEVEMQQLHLSIRRPTGRALIALYRFRFGPGRKAARWAKSRLGAASSRDGAARPGAPPSDPRA
jgi:hypothetical protein